MQYFHKDTEKFSALCSHRGNLTILKLAAFHHLSKCFSNMERSVILIEKSGSGIKVDSFILYKKS